MNNIEIRCCIWTKKKATSKFLFDGFRLLTNIQLYNDWLMSKQRYDLKTCNHHMNEHLEWINLERKRFLDNEKSSPTLFHIATIRKKNEKDSIIFVSLKIFLPMVDIQDDDQAPKSKKTNKQNFPIFPLQLSVDLTYT